MSGNLYEFIFKRKSNRKYDMTPLSDEQFNSIKAFAEHLKPLYENIKVEYYITNTVKNITPVLAPHYFVISSENKEGYLFNIGFMFQQMDLYLSSEGLGSCWLGLARTTEKIETKLEFVIILAFGKTVGSPYRDLSGFKRKSLAEIASGSDERLECAHLAPSASNTQNWFFACENGEIHVYQKKLNPVMALLYNKMNQIDIGIALCHLYVATENQGKAFTFAKKSNVKELKGYSYIGSVS